MSFRLGDLVAATGGSILEGDSHATDLKLQRLVIDSRQAGPGALFVALAGENTDGHEFLASAVAAGASALLVERPAEGVTVPTVMVPDTKEALVAFTRHQLEACGIPVVGVTGSAGKTSTKEMIAAVAAQRFEVLKTEGNLNTYTGLPMTVAQLEPRHHLFVAEFAMSAPGEIAFLARMAPPDYAVVLNVGLAHAGMPGLGSIDAVAAAKQELVEALEPSGVAILNADDPRVAAMAGASKAPVLTYGLGSVTSDAPPDVRAEELVLSGLGGSDFDLVVPGARVRAHVQAPGIHAVRNGLAAAATGHALGVPAEAIAEALGSVKPMGGRMTLVPGRHGATIIDDTYNASPDAVEAALAVLLAERGRPRIAVLGDMLELGDVAVAAHRRIGAAAAGADLLVALGEFADDIAAGARDAGMAADRVATAASASEVPALVESYLDRAVVLVKASRGVALESVVTALAEAR